MNGLIHYSINKPYLIKYDSGKDVMVANGRPNPRKYGQQFSISASLLFSSIPMLHHLYSNEYREYSKDKCTILRTVLRVVDGTILTR